MIWYFSATGNSRYVAEKVAEAIGDVAESIVGKGATRCDDEVVGLVYPTYCWGFPHIVEEFLAQADFSGAKYFFIATTYGGSTSVDLRRFVSRKPDALFGITFPDTATWLYDVSDAERVQATLDAARLATEEVAERIKRREVGDHIREKIPVLFGRMIHALLPRLSKTATLSVDENCIGCGLCARSCPASAIEIREGRPVWVKPRCEMCLSCLHHCPAFAIHRGKKTALHGQYDIKKYKV
ncbi:MAG: EFR1 family ferrodoxin [Clostridia bacterium]|nr:EFR1 family ferrodoxin [Clostridia bacterium]